MPTLLSIILLIASISLNSQAAQTYEKLLLSGENNLSIRALIFQKFQDSLLLKNNEKLYALYYNHDTTRIIFLTEAISTDDPTNDIRNDEHNKVNFITFGAFYEKHAHKYCHRIITALYFSLPNADARWYVHYSDSVIAYPAESHTGKLDFLTNSISLILIKNNGSDLAEEYWTTGLFEPTPDLRLDPHWEGYGKNVWKNKEQEFRPYIGVPALVRLFLSEEKPN